MTIKQKIARFILAAGILLVGALLTTVVCKVRREQKNRLLIAAVKRGDSSSVLSLVAHGADANSRDEPADTRPFWRLCLDLLRHRNRSPATSPSALLAAVEFGSDRDYDHIPDNVNMIEPLLDFGAKIDVKDDDGKTPLILAACMEPKSARLLIERGADVNAQSSGGFTSLMAAVLGDQEDTANLLLSRGANPNAQDFEGRTALMIAANGQHKGMVPLLLNWKADPRIKATNGESAMADAEYKLPERFVRIMNSAGAVLRATQSQHGVPKIEQMLKPKMRISLTAQLVQEVQNDQQDLSRILALINRGGRA